MKYITSACGILLMIAGTVAARIGETIPQVQARLGRVGLIVHNNTETYHKNGFRVEVVFEAGRSVCEIICHEIVRADEAKRSFGTSKPLSDTEIETLLKAYGDGLEWTKDDDRHWSRADSAAVALHNRNHRYTPPGNNYSDEQKTVLAPALIFMTATYADRLRTNVEQEKTKNDANKKEKESKALSDF